MWTELNSAELQGCSSDSLNSNASLPSVQSHRRHTERRVASWAVCFERLLQDPVGIRYFSVRHTDGRTDGRTLGSKPLSLQTDSITLKKGIELVFSLIRRLSVEKSRDFWFFLRIFEYSPPPPPLSLYQFFANSAPFRPKGNLPKDFKRFGLGTFLIHVWSLSAGVSKERVQWGEHSLLAGLWVLQPLTWEWRQTGNKHKTKAKKLFIEPSCGYDLTHCHV